MSESTYFVIEAHSRGCQDGLIQLLLNHVINLLLALVSTLALSHFLELRLELGVIYRFTKLYGLLIFQFFINFGLDSCHYAPLFWGLLKVLSHAVCCWFIEAELGKLLEVLFLLELFFLLFLFFCQLLQMLADETLLCSGLFRNEFRGSSRARVDLIKHLRDGVIKSLHFCAVWLLTAVLAILLGGYRFHLSALLLRWIGTLILGIGFRHSGVVLLCLVGKVVWRDLSKLLRLLVWFDEFDLDVHVVHFMRLVIAGCIIGFVNLFCFICLVLRRSGVRQGSCCARRIWCLWGVFRLLWSAIRRLLTQWIVLACVKTSWIRNLSLIELSCCGRILL